VNIYIHSLFLFSDSTFSQCGVSRDDDKSKGGALYIDQSGGIFVLVDARPTPTNTDGVTFDGCVSLGVRGYGGALYLHNTGGESVIGGVSLSFSSSCQASNGTEIFVDADNLEEALRDRITFDYEYDKTHNNYDVGMSDNNIFSITPLYLYDCYMRSRTVRRNLCPSCLLQCPPQHVVGIFMIIVLCFFFVIVWLYNFIL
jgi:hypothetical protein